MRLPRFFKAGSEHRTGEAAFAARAALPDPAGLFGVVDRMQLGDLTGYLPDDILVKVDRASMAASREARVPLIDHRVVAFAWSLPARFKMREGLFDEARRHLGSVTNEFNVAVRDRVLRDLEAREKKAGQAGRTALPVPIN